MYEIIEATRNQEEVKKNHSQRVAVPVSEKVLLTLDEAAAYTGIGINKLRILSEGENCPYVLWNGSKRLLKREKLRDFLVKEYSI